jgi:hypothetical protein
MLVSAQDNKMDCQKFKIGTFHYINDSSELVVVQRSKRYQVERNQKTGQVDKFKVKWVNDCTYEIHQFWSNSKRSRKNRGIITVKIINVQYDRYVYTCACKTVENAESFKGTMIRIK